MTNDTAHTPRRSRTLPDSSELFRVLFEQAADTLFICDREGRFVDANAQACRELGYRKGELLQLSLRHIDDAFMTRPEEIWFWKNLPRDQAFSMEVVHKRKDGSQFPVELRFSIIEPPEGGPLMLALGRNLSERRSAEKALRKSEERFRNLFDQAADALFIIDLDGRYIDINRQACLELGYSREEFLRMSVRDIDDDFRTRPKEKWFWETFPKNEAVSFEVAHKRKDGTKFPVEVKLSLIEASSKEKPHLLSLCRNITERKQAEAEIIRHRKHLEEMVRDRTAALESANAALIEENSERKRTEKALQKAIEEINALKELVEAENLYLKKEIKLQHGHEEIVGRSRALRKVLSQVELVADTDSTVLIMGETGTGKELIARAIHNMSRRKKQAMVKVNCAALPPTLIESELFGHEKGAFTGAVAKQVGRFETADGSTLFLDEISETSLALQAKLLRVLQEGQFERIGSSKTQSVSVRIIAATNRDLHKSVEEGLFREDLYYRLNVFPIHVPPLRDRREDLPLLVETFAAEFSQTMGKNIEQVSRKSIQDMMQYSWPGNIRELKNVIERSLILCESKTLTVQLPKGADGQPSTNRDESLEQVERQHIRSVLDATGWRIRGAGGAAERLGLKPTTLESKMKKLGLRREPQSANGN